MPTVTDYTALPTTHWNLVSGRGMPSNSPAILTFSFPTTPPPSYSATFGNTAISTFRTFTEAERAQTRSALDAWASASGLTFVEVNNGLGDIRFSWIDYHAAPNSSPDNKGVALYSVPSFFESGGIVYPASEEYWEARGRPYDVGGDVFLDWRVSYTPQQLFSLLSHEVGHAIGLKHSFDIEPTNDRVLSAAFDNTNYTVMSYTRVDGPRTGLGPLDVNAVQQMYGLPSSDGSQFSSWGFDAANQRMVLQGTGNSELIRGTGTHDYIYGFGGNDVIYASSGNDFIIGGAGQDSVSGGTGLDTYIFDFARGQSTYQRFISAEGFKQIIVTSSDGAERFVDVERLRFSDSIVAFDTDGNAGDAYRIYQAAFDRTPDRPGLSYWVDQMDDGMPLSQVALNFILSPEFASTYGNINAMSNAQYIDVMYDNVLHRDPDSSGFAYWMNELANGYPRHFMLAAFSQSAENQANVSAAIQNGVLLDLGAFV